MDSMNKQTRLAIGAIIIVLCLIGLGLTLKGSVVPYITVSELKSGDYVGEHIQINGTVVTGSVEWHPKDVLLTFQLTDGHEVVNVEYRGSIPNNFEEGKMVVVGGVYERDLFEADEILVKCPSKYTEEIEE
ncbi:MAG: CcmE/CycJ protein [Candidatus Syntrophoarchaeum caldarius]|uniref:CcmE/CycJ protein n=1 Tax=Candidatus Syntropharchaeum caldarium TaxID=1838285 RepID=A0A1F2PAG4_9EURY|nr:MAG: CcmE/CycJ protein [Candidatus Syntrophoarchaeum caldarius]